jgi:ATP-dependent RNA helicase DHR2
MHSNHAAAKSGGHLSGATCCRRDGHLQSPTAKVGYSVRFDNATGPGTKIKFLTEGMLLQEMLRDPAMSQYSAIVVDEVHERSVNVDLILGFLKNLVADMENGGSKRKDPLKVVIMSATADVDSLVTFFGDNGTSLPPTSKTKNEREISTCFVEGRQYPVKTVYLPEPAQDWVEMALKIIFQIHYKEPLPGDILVFLTGQDTIDGLEKLVNDYAGGMDKDVPKVSRAAKFCSVVVRSDSSLASRAATLCCASTTCPTAHLSAHAIPYAQGHSCDEYC